MSELAIPKGKNVKEPTREPDLISKRGVPYWFAPEWIRKSGKTCSRIIPVADDFGNVSLHMLSKTGNLTYIQGSIQVQFKNWLTNNSHEFVPWREDMEVDCLILGVEPSDLLLNDWEYE